MATTQIPPHKPFLPPPLSAAGRGEPRPESSPENLPVPAFLASLQDEMEKSQRREAFWMSVLVHLVALVAFVNGAKLLPAHAMVVPTNTEILQTRQLTFLVLPPDLQKGIARPRTNVLSDKNRVAVAREPVIDGKTLQHLLASSHKGASSTKLQPAQLKQPAAQSSAAQPEAEVASATPPMPIRRGQPEMASVPAPAPQATAPAAQNVPGLPAGTPQGGSASGGGTSPSGMSAAVSNVASHSNVDVISDTMGVDFGPYLSRVLRSVRLNWYSRIPDSARAPLMKRGKVSIQFDILRTGEIAAMQVVGTSGDSSLDGAAIAGINISGPFPPLPPQFQGKYLALRFHFFYNPDTNDPR